ncbi:MAG TPA: KamA family protein [Sphaerochaeta sp.]|nr:KamA family protein [Sphaerochaeta sp.]HOR80989.1 KamA family protein [Sphaerochaeta sp.]
MDIYQDLLTRLKEVNQPLTEFFLDATYSEESFLTTLKERTEETLKTVYPEGWAYLHGEKNFYRLSEPVLAHVRLYDYLVFDKAVFKDGTNEVTSRPVTLLRSFLQKKSPTIHPDVAEEMVHFFALLSKDEPRTIPTRGQVQEWMERHPSGLDDEVIAWRKKNKERIIDLLIRKIDERGSKEKRYTFKPGHSEKEKRWIVDGWWKEDRFHLYFALRSTKELDTFLGNTLDEETKRIMEAAEAKGIPIFVTPYFLSLIDTRPREEQEHPFADEPIRSYLFYSRDLVDEFGEITAWEKEDAVEIGKPNAAGWVLPSHNIHRRYPNVAIFIPDTMGRACGGLCAYCQRMYDFQAGRFNFELEKLRPKKSWPARLKENMEYFRSDPYLWDILITGGDAFMSSVKSLREILEAVLQMAKDKVEDNTKREEPYAVMKRVRLGTKLPVYLPQRVTGELADTLAWFKRESAKIGIEQCVIQTHFSSAMEVTPDTEKAVGRILKAGWAVTNQEVFTVAASRRGHSAKLRKVLNDIGVLPYYNFTVKGFRENRALFATNARSVQELVEESSIGAIAPRYHARIRSFIFNAKEMKEQIDSVRESDEIPFISPDRNTINLPGVGKSNTYRTIGLTDDGRRILRFEFDHTRPHSKVIEEMHHVDIVESKSIARYLRQLEAMGEDPKEYESIWGYSAGEMEERSPVFEGVIESKETPASPLL